MPSQAIDLTGNCYGRWTVLERAQNAAKGGHTRWWCQCECGTRAEVYGVNLRRGTSACCGRGSCNPNYLHGDAGGPIYNAWRGMRDRCGLASSVNYHRYGARGITVDPAWDTFEAFRAWAYANGYEVGRHLHRIDNAGNYSPANCRFLTASEHSRLHYTGLRTAA